MLPPVQRVAPAARIRARDSADRPDAARVEETQRVEPAEAAVAADRHPPRPADPEPGTDLAGRLGRSYAPLVAHLVATALGLAQTRSRRRASMEDATALYRRVREKAKSSRGFA